MPKLLVRQTPASAATVRHSVHFAVEEAGLGMELADDAALLISELLTNAVQHASPLPSGHLEAGWEFDDRGVRVHVTDGGADGQHPQVRTPEPGETTGRGLAIVVALADDWGVEERPTGTTVWAHVTRVPVIRR